MFKQLHKEQLILQKSFSDLYCHLVDKNNNEKFSSYWVQEKKKLQCIIAHLNKKVIQLENELHGANERCELLEFCFLELENEKKDSDHEDLVDSAVNTDPCWVSEVPSNLNLLDLAKLICDYWVSPFEKQGFQAYTYSCYSGPIMDQKLCRKKLEESRKKLTDISKQVDYGNKDGQWCCIDQVVSSIEELQNLIAWISEKKGSQEDNTVIFQKLQQLNKIRKVLEKTAAESQKQFRYFRKTSPGVSEFENYIQENGNTGSAFFDDRKIVPPPSLYRNSSPTELLEKSNGVLLNNKSDDKVYSSLDTYNKNLDSDRINLYIKKLCSLASSQSIDLGKEIYDQHDSLGTAISEDEGLGEESRRADSTGPNSLLEIGDSISDILTQELAPPAKYCDPSSPGIQRRDQAPWIRDSCCHRNSIELCLATINKLKESLHAKETEILKLKNSSQGKSDSTELQVAIDNLQRNIDELQSSVFLLEKENTALKENILELEEAENDARLQGQRVEEKLIFLQQKDSHFQAEFAETKRALKLCLEELSLKDADERQLHSQLKFMEALVQKYEGQLKNIGASTKYTKENHVNVERGTQTYWLPDCAETDDLKTAQKEEPWCFMKTRQITCKTSNEERKHCGVQTDSLENLYPCEELQSLIRFNFESQNDSCEGKEADSCIPCPAQEEMFTRLNHLVKEDADLQQQLNDVDQINVALWQKLHNLQFHIEECQEKSLFSAKDENITSTTEKRESNMTISETIKCANTTIFTNFDCSEEKLKERLLQVEKINCSFLKQLEIREKLYLEQERRHEKWLKMEDQLTGELKSLGAERDSLLTQVTQLEAEKLQLSSRVKVLEAELSFTREKHQKEASKITSERDEMMAHLQKTIDDLLVREKEYMKQIAKLKSTKNKAEEKNEFEVLKSSYVQLQIELVGYRDQMENVRNEFDDQLDSLKENHSIEENRLLGEIGAFKGKNYTCEKKLDEFQNRHLELENNLHMKERDLERARTEFKRHMHFAEKEHKAVEAELRKKLCQMEEETAFATKALTEERVRLEKELQVNIDDLRSKEELYKSRILELESNVSQLHDELHRLTGNLNTKFVSDGIPNETASYQRERLLSELQELREREGELREKLDEMEKKELAYRETLEHADRIVASVERGYKNKIEELEMSERCLKQRVGYLEDVENRLRAALQKERRSSDGRKPDDLKLELADAEKRENNLKEEIDSLEISNRSATSRVRELEKVQQRLESQLNDHEDLATSLEKLQHEQEAIRKELTKLRKSENNLQLALHQAEGLLVTRESEISSELKRFTSEKHELEETINQLRSQVRDLHENLDKRSVEGEALGKNIPLSVDMQDTAPHTKSVSQPITSGLPVREPPELKKDIVENKSANTVIQSSIVPLQRSSLMSPKAVISSTDNANACAITPFGNNTDKKITKEKPRVSFDVLGTSENNRAEKEYSEVRLQLEECMLRAMDAMKMEMDNKQPTELFPGTSGIDKNSLLPPYNFRVVQQVGSDTLLVGWEYADVPNLEGFELYVNDQLHETVYAPDRRKAVISGLDIKKPLVLSICSVATTGQVSKPQTLDLSQNATQGFFFQDDDDEDDDELFDDDVPDKQSRPYSVEW